METYKIIVISVVVLLLVWGFILDRKNQKKDKLPNHNKQYYPPSEVYDEDPTDLFE